MCEILCEDGMKIYLSCGLTHVPQNIFPHYVQYIHSLAEALASIGAGCYVKYALVHSDPQLAKKPSDERASLCYDWDRRMVEEADIVVADASFPSTGVGIELQIADSRGIPIVMLIGDYRENRVKSAHYTNADASQHDLQVGEGIVSLMALGIPSNRRKIAYTCHATAISQYVEAVSLFLPGIRTEP
jgi:hypothetical protein